MMFKCLSLTLLLASSLSAIAADFSALDERANYRCSDLAQIGCTGLFPVSTESDSAIAVIPSGEDSLALRLQLLESARRSIRIQTLIFTGDEAGLKIAELLKKKKKEGLDVRVNVDALSALTGSHRASKILGWQTQWMYYDLKQHGIEVEGYESLYLGWINEMSAKDPQAVNKRFHDKMWIIDGEEKDGLAIVGGLNIANEYFRVEKTAKLRWRDQDVILRGAIVSDVVDTFERNCSYFKEVKASRPGVFNTANAWKHWYDVIQKTWTLDIPYDKSKDAAATVEAFAKRSVYLDWQPTRARFLQNRPRYDESYIHQTYLSMMADSRSSILIANAYFIPENELVEAMKAAVRRGVDVTILTNSRETNDMPQMADASRYIYKDLLDVNKEPKVAKGKARMNIWEWGGARYNEGTLHAKFAVFDEKAAIVGSHNLDSRSQHLNSETVVVFENQRLASQLASQYRKDLGKSVAITPQQAETFHNPSKAAEKFNLFLSLKFRPML